MEVAMNWDRVEGNWKQLKGKVKTKWGKLTDDDLTAINGKREQLEGKLQECYGFAKDQAQKEVDAWFRAQTWERKTRQDLQGPAFTSRALLHPIIRYDVDSVPPWTALSK
jgi:uncharacterized protein YjbJ (UPF0337 family)